MSMNSSALFLPAVDFSAWQQLFPQVDDSEQHEACESQHVLVTEPSSLAFVKQHEAPGGSGSTTTSSAAPPHWLDFCPKAIMTTMPRRVKMSRDWEIPFIYQLLKVRMAVVNRIQLRLHVDALPRSTGKNTTRLVGNRRLDAIMISTTTNETQPQVIVTDCPIRSRKQPIPFSLPIFI